jgi:putative lipoprotein (rSAM/lipoprotein system)
MKRNFLKKYNYFLAVLLSVLGMGGACTVQGCEYGTPVAEYGTPSATFIVHGSVTSEGNTKIPNIRVVMQFDTTFTDADGKYKVQAFDFPDDHDFLVEVDDIDGTASGSYQSKDTIVSFVDPQFTGGDGLWNQGETTKEINIKLKAKN